MNDSFLTPEVESLIQGYVEGELSESECARLRELLDASPALVKPILTSLRTDTLIHQTVLQAARTDLETVPNREMVRAEGPALPKSEPFRRFAIPFAIAGCLAGLAVLGGVLFAPAKPKVIPSAGSGS